jgi:hypothetical protein
MDEREQRFIVKILWLQGLSGKATHAQLSGKLAESALSLSTAQWSLRRRKDGDKGWLKRN